MIFKNDLSAEKLAIASPALAHQI